MATYTVDFAPIAARQFSKLAGQVKRRVGQKIDALETNPRPPGVEKLEGEGSFYRVRVGDFRIVYQISDKLLLVLVVKIADRKEVYRK
jgi:mRNA interferase RelE/StbE